VERLRQLRDSGELTTAHVRLAASGLGVAERSVWRWLGPAADRPGTSAERAPYRLSEADREAYARYRGNVAAVHRARSAVLADPGAPTVLAAGVPVPASLCEGWRGAPPVTRRTLQRAFRRELAAAWAEGEEGHRAAGVYLTRPAGHRNQVWEMDHKQLPILVMPPRGAACCPWVTTVVDDATRVLAGWAIALTPHAGTVLTAVRMALVHDPDRGPFGAIPARVRIDRGLEFAAGAVHDALGIDDPGVLAGYRDMPVRWRHTAEIRDRYGYRDFTGPDRFAFTAWLYRQAWADEVASSVLFRAAHRQLLARQILLPGHSVLTRLIATVRERATHRVHSRLARAVGPELRAQLEKLLLVPEGQRRSELDLFGSSPSKAETHIEMILEW